MNQPSSVREDPQSVPLVLTSDSRHAADLSHEPVTHRPAPFMANSQTGMPHS